jgi:mannose-6-phosphate isomerase-like protein (cupin superfamily)
MRTRTALVIALFSVSGAFGFAQTAGRGGGEGRTPIVEKAPADHSVAIPLAKLQQYYKDMDGKKQQTLRMLEGGRYNVNIRRITNAETALVHPDTADVWVVTEGAGTLTTGGTLEGGKIVGGESHPIKVGDVEFIPAGVPHGVSGVTGSITWLNIRFDTNY